jgi:hypothetical protein
VHHAAITDQPEYESVTSATLVAFVRAAPNVSVVERSDVQRTTRPPPTAMANVTKKVEAFFANLFVSPDSLFQTLKIYQEQIP